MPRGDVRFDCYLLLRELPGGRVFRPPRPIEKVLEELTAIDNNRLYIVDNSLSQDKAWEKQLFREMIPLKKKWCCHPIENDDEVLDPGSPSWAWYVYQAIFDTFDFIRDRLSAIATSESAWKDQSSWASTTIRKTISAAHRFPPGDRIGPSRVHRIDPFPHTRLFAELQAEGRILSYNWK